VYHTLSKGNTNAHQNPYPLFGIQVCEPKNLQKVGRLKKNTPYAPEKSFA
jgi:hypothetical protein